MSQSFFLLAWGFFCVLFDSGQELSPIGLEGNRLRQQTQIPTQQPQIKNQNSSQVNGPVVQDPVLGRIDLPFLKLQQQQLSGKKDLPADILKLVLDHYKMSENYLQELSRIDRLIQGVAKTKSELPSVIQSLKQQTQSTGDQSATDLEKLTLLQLEQKKTAMNQTIAKLQTKSSGLASAQARKRQELGNIKESITRLENQRRSRIGDRSPQSGEPPLVKAWTVEKVVTDRLIQRIKEYQLASKALFDEEVANEFYVLSRHATDKNLEGKKKELAAIQKRIELVRQIQANKTKKEVRATESVFPELKGVAENLKKLADESASLVKKLGEVEAERDQSAAELVALEERFESIKAKVDAVGLTPSIGKLLRKQRLDLRTTSFLSLQSSNQSTLIDDAQFQRFQYEEELGQMPTEEEYVRSILNKASRSAGTTLTNEKAAKLTEDAKKFWKQKKTVLGSLVKNYNSYFDALVDLDTNHKKLENTSNIFGGYIDQRVLWIPSSKPLYQSFRDDVQALWIWNPVNWWRAVESWWSDAKSKPAIWLLLVTILAVLAFRNSVYHNRITLSGKKARAGHCTEFRPTWNALFHTLLISTPWPALLFFLGWRLLAFLGSAGHEEISESDQMVISSIGSGLKVVAAVLLPLECLRYLCRKDGLGQAHFSWQPKSSSAMMNLIGQMRFIGLPILFLTCALHHSTPQFGNDLAGRICFIVGLFVLMYALYRTFAPNAGILRSYYARHAGGWIDRLRYVWFSAAFFFPIALVILAASGYYYTAWHLSIRLYYVFLMVLSLLFVQELIARLILIGGRKSYIQQAKLRRQQATDQQAGLDEELAAAMLIDNEDWTQEVKQQTVQSNNLLNGLIALSAVFIFWAIWADVVPALRVVLNQALWTTTETVSQVAESVQGKDPQIVSTQVLRVITPADLFQTVGIIILTVILFRNLPGLVDILILNRLPIDQSTQLAITSICSYAVIVVGTVFSANQLGINWTGIQWLVTAFTFGLAFGLQEIFANFVAGIILMFERPIRVGDVVTIGDVTGVVKKTRARATTIRNWDLKELIVPNKEFITGRVLNWTLSDQLSRIVINVGVAYGTNTELVRDRLVEVASSHPLVLDTPAPLATMESFGDSTLDFVLRAYVGKLGDRLKVTSELHQAIEKDFNENEIEIAFPQLDVNLTTTDSEAEGS